jgi:hypothetical protein
MNIDKKKCGISPGFKNDCFYFRPQLRLRRLCGYILLRGFPLSNIVSCGPMIKAIGSTRKRSNNDAFIKYVVISRNVINILLYFLEEYILLLTILD